MKFLSDLLPVILFFIAYQAYDIYVATAVAIAASLVQVSWSWLARRNVEKMQLVTLGLLILFGGLTLLLRDPVFIKWKPTVVNWLFALAFIGAQLFTRSGLVERMMGHAVTMPKPVWNRLNIAWSLFFLFMGGLNLYVAFNYPEASWVNFKLFGMMGATLLFIVGQSLYMAKYFPEQERETASREN